MSGTIKTHRELTVPMDISAVRDAILLKLHVLEGRLIRSENNYIECDFGSLLESRLIGEFWVPASTLPKKAVLNLQANSEATTRIIVDVYDTHRFGFMWGYVEKYKQAIDDVADTILSAVQ
jgi:hypothetical protein